LALRRLEREGAAPPALPVACACAPPAQREAALQREATRHELARHETTHRAARARTTRDDWRCRWRLPRFQHASGLRRAVLVMQAASRRSKKAPRY